MSKEFLTVKEVSAKLHTMERTIRELIKRSFKSERSWHNRNVMGNY
jgi:hypothetical protein